MSEEDKSIREDSFSNISDHEEQEQHHHDENEHHHHEHETIPSLEVTTHEVATIGSIKCFIPGEYSEALDILQKCMLKTAQMVEARGGLIGHIKAFCHEISRNCMISVTDGEDVQRKNGIESGIYVENANIVFNITPDKLKEILKSTFQPFLNELEV